MHKLREVNSEKLMNDAGKEDVYNLIEWAEDTYELNYDTEILPYIFYNQFYWAHLGYSVGSEQAYDRPVLVVDCYKTSNVCVIIPITLERLGDGRDYHVDLSNNLGTALVEQIRAISKFRIFDYVYDKNTRRYAIINSIDRENINVQLSKICCMKPLYQK
ncbi:protein of unknown function [Ruminococcaceae bacterium BL-6]|nr:protein of unknown function [Ruminococcaceae bacterium BL-6]